MPIGNVSDMLRSLISDGIRFKTFDELTWIDFKSKWPDLSTPNTIQHNEFIRDICALANTGYDAFLVFGVDQKGFSIPGSQWKECKLPDTADIVNRVRPRVDPPFEMDVADFGYEDKVLSYVCIPTTHNRPHLIKIYKHINSKGHESQAKNALVWREGSTTVSPPEYPDRQKLSAMFADRPYSFSQLKISDWESKLSFQDGGTIWIPVQICNIGSSPTSVLRIRISAQFSKEAAPWRQLEDRDICTYLDKTKSTQVSLPLHIPIGNSIAICMLVNIDRDNLHSITPYWVKDKSNKLIVQVRVWDMLGMEYRHKLTFDCPF
jgi:hypothetical protein